MNLLAATMPEWANRLIVAIGWALVLFLVQGLVLGLLVAALMRVLRNRPAAVRYAAACAGLLLMALCPIVTAGWTIGVDRRERAASHPAASTSHRTGAATTAPAGVAAHLDERESAAVPAAGRALTADVRAAAASAAPLVTPWPARERLEAWLPTVVAAWLAGVCVLALRLLAGLVEVRGLARRGLIELPDELRALVARLAERAGLRGPVRWFLSVRVEVPSVFGWLRPTVLLPAGHVLRLTAQQVEALLAHEVAHILRDDYLVNVVQAAIESLLFFHPAVWWVSRRIRVERESCCDDRAADLCGGDRILVARALLALEELRSAPALAVAATGGSLRDRIRRLVAPGSNVPLRGGSGWIGAGLLASILAIVATAWQASGSSTLAAETAAAGKAAIHGRVVDEQGKAVSGANVRLYRREGQWERKNRMVEQVQSGADGAYSLTTPLEPDSLRKTGTATTFVLLADHPGKAVGWRKIPDDAASFEGDIALTQPTERTITVNGPDGTPMAGARVVAYSLGDATASEPYFRDLLSLWADEGPLVTLTDAQGHARFAQLPRTDAGFVAFKADHAESLAFLGQDTIHLTRSATLKGTVTGPDGKPLAGVKVVLNARFMNGFDFAVTDAQGRYRAEGLKANGWDMGPWFQGQKGNGAYSVWLDSERFAAPQKSVTLQPYDEQTFDIEAQDAVAIRIKVLEEGTDRPLAGVEVTSLGEGGRLTATTDETGRATMHTVGGPITLSLGRPPRGTYIDLPVRSPSARVRVDALQAENEVVMKMPPITGPLISVSGTASVADRSPATKGVVHSEAGKFYAGTRSPTRTRRLDGQGRFAIDDLPAGHELHLYAESDDGKLAGTASAQLPHEADPAFRVPVTLRPTVSVTRTMRDAKDQPLALHRFAIQPRVGDEDITFPLQERRTVDSDAQGQIKLDRIVPGLEYRVHDDGPIQDQRPNRGVPGPRPLPPGAVDPELIVLAPEKPE